MFAKRNSLTLGTIWLLILLAGIFWYVKDARRLVQVLQQKKKYQEQLQRSQSQIERLTEVETLHEQVSKKWAEAPKKILAVEEPAFTLSYLNKIVSANNLNVSYDFVLNEKAQVGDYIRLTYTLTGEGSYQDINEMIWSLTYQPILYKISNISLSRINDDLDNLKFVLRLTGFSLEDESAETPDFQGFQEASLPTFVAQHDIFKPALAVRRSVAKVAHIEKPKLPPRLPGQVDVEKAKLRAVTPSSVFISDGDNGLNEISVGDPVYLGRLIKIDQQNNQAEFVITKFGNSQKIILTIQE